MSGDESVNMEGGRGRVPLMPEEALRADLARFVVLRCRRVALRLAFAA